jgi:hypothetical protein
MSGNILFNMWCKYMCNKHSRQDPLIGVWTLQLTSFITTPPISLFGNIEFQVGGTLTGGDTGSIGGPAGLPAAALATSWTGRWKHVSKRRYKMFIVTTLNAITETTPYLPIGRLSINGDITISKDGKTIKITNIDVNFYNNSDPTLSNPTFVTTASIDGYKISFHTFGQ